MAHSRVDEAEEILDEEFPVLDKGFVRLVDYLGGDSRIVQSARVSYGAGTKSYRKDRGLIRYLLRNEHTSPFEQVVLTFHIKMPIFVARQWIRHRTARVNEISGRYSVIRDEFYVPDGKHISGQSSDNKQGRDEEPLSREEQERIAGELGEAQRRAYEEYEALLESGLARELARINLPVSVYTEIYWQIDLHNLFHFLRLRMDAHAQYEIRAYAEKLFEVTKRVCPIACEAFEDYVLGAARFSREELALLRELLDTGEGVEERVAAAAERRELSERATRELLEKLTGSTERESAVQQKSTTQQS